MVIDKVVFKVRRGMYIKIELLGRKCGGCWLKGGVKLNYFIIYIKI